MQNVGNGHLFLDEGIERPAVEQRTAKKTESLKT
jgi:hypothetical protein